MTDASGEVIMTLGGQTGKGEGDMKNATDNKQVLYSQLAEKIYQFIKENNMKPGDRLPGERTLAAKWQVSRPTLREAIRELANQGVIYVEVGKGTYVADYVEGRQLHISLALKNFLELFEIKNVLERYSLQKVIPTISEERLDHLEQIAVQMNAVAQLGIMPKDMDHQFHRYLVESYGNREISNLVWNMIIMYESFDDELYGYFKSIGYDYETILLKTFPYHVSMVQRMKERNVEEALKNYDSIVDLDLEMYAKIRE